MQVSELTKRFGQEGRQMGNRLIYISSNGIEETVHGFTIAMYDSATQEPVTVYNDIEKTAPLTKGMTWDDAHDALFGAPTKPRFGNNLISQ